MSNSNERPTLGLSVKISEGAENFFTGWLPPLWRKRKESPDVFVDYCVESVENGEPTGALFRVQVKGRSVHKRKARQFKEPIKTKHLRYYLQCREPVFIFLIDPTAGEGRWVFIQKYLRKHVVEAELHDQKKLVIPFAEEDSMRNKEKFHADLTSAWTFVNNMFPGSPIAAITEKQKLLKKLDPRYAVEIQATTKGMSFQIKPNNFSSTAQLDLLPGIDGEKIKNLFEKGQSFEIKTSDIDTENSPIFKHLMAEFGNANLTVSSTQKIGGCLQFSFTTEGTAHHIQVDGDWILAPKRLSFEGQLRDSPLRVDFHRDIDETGQFDPHAPLHMKIDWSLWREQPLLSLGFFNDILSFLKCKTFSVKCLIRGNEAGKAEMMSSVGHNIADGLDALELISRCRNACKALKVNPLFPEEADLDSLQTGDVQALLSLLEKGEYEFSSAGQSWTVEGHTDPGKELEVSNEGADTTLQNQFHVFDFFKIKIRFGPIDSVVTDVRLSKVEKLEGINRRVTWECGPKSTWRMKYQDFGAI